MANGTRIVSMLTTSDNPFNPFDDFDSWYAYDTRAGHHSASYLARIAATSDELSQPDQDRIIDQAIDEIVRENINGMYVKVSRETEI